MASVTSLDADVRNLRLSRYTPQAANEVRAWIESSLNTQLASGDLLEALKDGTVLCQLANLAIHPQHGAIKWKKSAMPFIQMENISHFLKACEMPPLNLPAHDRFLTVDLYEGKDAAQVLQCLGAFSRQANRVNPHSFPTTIGPKKATAGVTPSINSSLTSTPSGSSGRPSAQNSTSASTSSWSKRSDEGSTAPAWNIHQYGYMGGASQGNQGITFGARRQITTQGPVVPSLAEKEKLRKEKEAAALRQRQHEAEEEEQRRRVAAEDEQRLRVEEEQRWEQETERMREEERRRLELQKREWEEQERKWKQEEDARRREEASMQRTHSSGTGVLRGQSLAEYQKEQAGLPHLVKSQETPEQKRVRELEQQLEEARERERRYQTEREERLRRESEERSRPSTAQAEMSRPQSENSWTGDEREFLRQQWQSSRDTTPAKPALPPSNLRPLPSSPEPSNLPSKPHSESLRKEANVGSASPFPSRPSQASTTAVAPLPSRSSTSTRPLPGHQSPKGDESFESEPVQPNRTEQFLATNAAPHKSAPRISSSNEAGDTALEQSRYQDARIAGQQKTKAGAWASKSLLEREMERERERQREWEANQHAVKDAPRDASQGTGQGQTWDVNQYGYIGGDNMNRGSGVGSGINIGGRRQIIGPRPKP